MPLHRSPQPPRCRPQRDGKHVPDNTVWLDAAATKKGQPATPGTIGFHGVPEDVWNFHIGGYQVCEKWLKDRKGRTLSDEDLVHYQKIVVALKETIRLMGEIDEVIEAHGGWPGAFAVAETAGAAAVSEVPAAAKAQPAARPEPLPFVYEPAEPRKLKVAEANEPLRLEVTAADNREEPAATLDLVNYDVICHIRQVVGNATELDRDAAIDGLAQRLGSNRADPRIRAALGEALRVAEERGIVRSQEDNIVLVARSMDDYDRQFLKEAFLAALPGMQWLDRDDAIHGFARRLGFRRTGSTIRDAGRSLINGLLREKRLERDGARIRRSL